MVLARVCSSFVYVFARATKNISEGLKNYITILITKSGQIDDLISFLLALT